MMYARFGHSSTSFVRAMLLVLSSAASEISILMERRRRPPGCDLQDHIVIPKLRLRSCVYHRIGCTSASLAWYIDFLPLRGGSRVENSAK